LTIQKRCNKQSANPASTRDRFPGLGGPSDRGGKKFRRVRRGGLKSYNYRSSHSHVGKFKLRLPLSINKKLRLFFPSPTITKPKISNTFPMAKSLRSKTKRAFRSKKRQEGVYAAAAAGRLHRLNAKLQQVTKKDLDGDVRFKEEENQEEEPGWCWFATFGLLDPNDVTLDSLESLSTGRRSYGRGSASAPWTQSRCLDSSEDSI